MIKNSFVGMIYGALLALTGPAMGADTTHEAPSKLAASSRSTLNKLYARVSGAKAIGTKAVAVLVFPKVTKAGLMIGGQYGEGTLFKDGKAVAYYSTAGASYGLQAGAQTYGYAMFFMNDKALAQLDSMQGMEIGVGPSVVVMDEGMAKSTTTNTLKDDIYAFIFSQQGLMAGLGLQGNKISKLEPKR
jgi:lipid-binding SYLF domain-containing protein